MSKSSEWYLQQEEKSIREFERMVEEREQAVNFVKKAWDFVLSTSKETHNSHLSQTFHAAIWEASTFLLPKLEVQVVIDANNVAHVSTGSPGYVDFKINPVGMKLPIKCWIHTHPFGSAYFSGTDIRTVSIWGPKMQCALVLGGLEHYGYWDQSIPKQLMIFDGGEHLRTQTWGEEE